MELNPDFIAVCKQVVEMERDMAKRASKQLSEAIRNNVQDIDALDRMADNLMDTMLGLSGAGERTYLQYIRYLETFNPAAAKETKENYEELMDYKIHAAYAAAKLAKELHKGQVDKAGKDYFEEHLSTVAGKGFGWKEKVVGFLHDAAEDTDYTVKEVIRALKKILADWKKNSEQDWHYEFEDSIRSLPNEKYHPLTKTEWDEIEEALNLMNSCIASSREEYIERFRGNMLTIKVKLNDLQHNMDISRILNPTERDVVRIERYKREYAQLVKMLEEVVHQKDRR